MITLYLWTDIFLNLRASTTKEFKLPCVSVTPYLQSSKFPMVWVKHGQGSSKNDAARGPRGVSGLAGFWRFEMFFFKV